MNDHKHDITRHRHNSMTCDQNARVSDRTCQAEQPV